MVDVGRDGAVQKTVDVSVSLLTPLTWPALMVSIFGPFGVYRDTLTPEGKDVIQKLQTQEYHLLSLADINPVEMGIQGVGEFQLPVFYPGMADDDNVSPGGMDVTGQDYETVSDRVHRFSETFFAAAVSHEPVLSQMAAASEAARLVVAVSVRRGHGKVEPVGRFGDALGAGRKQASPKKQEGGAQR